MTMEAGSGWRGPAAAVAAVSEHGVQNPYTEYEAALRYIGQLKALACEWVETKGLVTVDSRSNYHER